MNRQAGSLAHIAKQAPKDSYPLGSQMVETKANEIPLAQELVKPLDLQGSIVSLDALHTQDETARALVLKSGAPFLLTAEGNRQTVKENIEKQVPAPDADFPPPHEPTPTQFCTLGITKSRIESRAIQTQRPSAPSKLDSSWWRQAARLQWQTTGREDEHVRLFTNASPEELDAPKRLHLNRAGFGGIETLRTSVWMSPRMVIDAAFATPKTCGCWACFDDWPRVSSRNGIPTRPIQSLRPPRTSRGARAEDHRRAALRIVCPKRPNFAFT